MMKQTNRNTNRIEIIKPPTSFKYKKFCNHIINKHSKKYIIGEGHDRRVSIPLLMNIIIDKRKPSTNNKYAHNCKYREIEFINGIIDVASNCGFWSRYKGLISGSYLNKRHNQYVKWDVYECLFRIMVNHYMSDSKSEKLQYQAIDTTFVKNLYGVDMYGRNVEYKSKNGIKISAKTDRYGVPISLALASANSNDAKIAIQQEDYDFIDTNTKAVKNNNKYKQTILADAAYDNKELRDKWEKKGYIVKTSVNKRRTKDPNKLKQLNDRQKSYLKVAKKRTTVESLNSWIHKYPKLDRQTEKTIGSYTGLLFLNCSFIVAGKL